MIAATSSATIAAFAVAAYGALLSTFLAIRQVLRDRRKLEVTGRSLVLVAGDRTTVEVLEVRAFNDGLRPIHVRQAGVVTEEGTTFHPQQLPMSRFGRSKAPVMLSDGESVSFYFDLLNFEDEGYTPKAVWVQDFADRRYTRRLSRKTRRGIEAAIPKIRRRVGASAESQLSIAELPPELPPASPAESEDEKSPG